MTIKFECPNCQRKLSVKDELAGKKGKCPGCQKNIQIPVTSTAVPARPEQAPTVPVIELPPPTLPPPPSLDGPDRSQEEADAEALDALIDKPAEDAPPEKLEFDCPMCGEKLSLGLEFAGKRAPCPECRRIIKVPELPGKAEKKDWRQVGNQPPPPPVIGEGENPDAHLGASAQTGLSEEAKDEFDLIPRREKPVPLWIRLFPYTVGTLTVLFVGSFVWWLLGWLAAGAEQRMYDGAIAYSKSDGAIKEISREGVASLHRAAGVFQFRRKASDSAAKGQEQFEAALGLLAVASGRSERDAVLVDVIQALLPTIGTSKTDPAVERGEKLDPDAAQKLLTGLLRTMNSPEARREAVQAITRQLIARNEVERALALAGLGFSQPVDRAEAQAIVGLELVAAGKKEDAGRAVELALLPYAASPAPTPSPAVVALALLMQKPPPKAARGSLDVENEYLGRVEALAREAKLDEARALALSAPDPRLGYRRILTIAEVTAATDAQDVEKAAQLLDGPLRGNPNVSPWSVYQLVQLGAKAKVSSDRLREIARHANDRDLRGRCLLVALQQDLATAPAVQPVPSPATEKFDADGLARLLATELICRQNGLLNSSWGNDVQGWEEKLKAFGALGLLQGRYSR